MARKKAPSEDRNLQADVTRRLREIRQELFGERGGPELARRLNLPARSWYNYETGVTVPAEVLLRFIDITGANPVFLMTGEGPRYLAPDAGPPAREPTLTELLRRALERLERSPAGSGEPSPGGTPADYLAIPLHPLERIGEGTLDGTAAEGEVLALRRWVANPSATVAARLTDDAMNPVLPAGSIAAIDRSSSDPRRLQGRIVAARTDDRPMIRWLDVSGRHLILRPNVPGGEFPLVPLAIRKGGPSPILGQVVFSWNRFGGS